MALNGEPEATPVTTRGWTPASPEGRVTEMTTCDSSVRAAASKALATAARFSAVATDPPPAVANVCSTSPFASGLLNATTSARTFPLVRAAIAALSFAVSLALPPFWSSTVSPPSLSRMMLRSPTVPSDETASRTPSYSAVSPRERSPSTARCTATRSVVGCTSTPEVDANETTPTLTSFGTAARKSLTALLTVEMPLASMEPLVSMTSIVDRALAAVGVTVTDVGAPPRVAVTDCGSTTEEPVPRMTRVPLRAGAEGRRSLTEARSAAGSAWAAPGMPNESSGTAESKAQPRHFRSPRPSEVTANQT